MLDILITTPAPVEPEVEEVESDSVAKRISRIDRQLVTFREEHKRAEVECDQALADRGTALSRGQTDPFEAYQQTVDHRDRIAGTIDYLEQITLPQLLVKLQAEQRSDKNQSVQELETLRAAIVEEMQNHVFEIDILLAEFDTACKAMKHGYPKRMTPIRELWFTENLRKALENRTRRRIAKQIISEL